MLVGVIQSNYIPWRGYFDFIDEVDVFIFHDDILFTRDWRNRNYINVRGQREWLTVPVNFSYTLGHTIEQTKICYSSGWVSKHLRRITEAYSSARYFEHYFPEFKAVLSVRYETISELNLALIRWVMEKLEISTRLVMSRDLEPLGTKTERLIDMLKKLGATHYLSGPAAEDYLDVEQFRSAGIGLSYKQYKYPEYPQGGLPFADNVSILDVLFHCGPSAKSLIKSELPPRPIVVMDSEKFVSSNGSSFDSSSRLSE